MTGTRLLHRLCVALVTTCCLLLSAVPLAQAGKSKPNVVRTSGQHVNSGRSFTIGHHRHFRHGRLKLNRFHKHDKRLSFAKSRKHKRRHVYVPTYYYGYRRGYRYRNYPSSTPSYRSEKSDAVQPNQYRPVIPKWVHVGDIDGTLGPPTIEEPYGGGGLRRNCLSVKTEITIDGKPMEAFGEACLLADGTWQLEPSEQND